LPRAIAAKLEWTFYRCPLTYSVLFEDDMPMRSISYPARRLALLAAVCFWAATVDWFPARGEEPKEKAKVAEPTAEQVEFFEKKIRPLLVNHCYECHSAQADEIAGNLRLDWRGGLIQGGDSGPAIVPGDASGSRLIRAVRHDDPDLKMPPEKKLSDAEIADLVAWVKMGAPDPRVESKESGKKKLSVSEARQFWSLKPVEDPGVPKVKDKAWPRGDIDRFILQKLEAQKLRPAADADRRTLLRRATYDLTGLPPTPDEIEAFLKDKSPRAFAKVVDRLLATRAYGERWGRHWLDVVRYADTAGDNSDYPIPQMVKYRNWVIDAIQADMPYDEFVRQQLAGDLLPADSQQERYSQTIATGYLANSRRFGSYEDTRYPWHLTIEDTIDNLGRTFLGLTINCARCHDHKFDPISNEDYYALYGFFQSTRYPWPGIELDKAQHDLVPLAPEKEIAEGEKRRKQELARLDAKIKKVEAEQKEANEELAKIEKAKDDDDKKEKVAAVTKRLAQLKTAVKVARKQREDFNRQPLPYELAYAVAEGKTEGKKKVGNACVQIKGDPERQGAEVPRRFLTVLGGQLLPENAEGSGRLELARWITDPANPLTARVMVNRLWHYHFGRGIAATPSDFGKQGTPPTHPELLDWLACRFVEGGWSLKKMHRLILLSHTYQVASSDDGDGARLDPNNELFGRFPRRRLDAESIRDTLLAVSGTLDTSTGGEHPFPEPKKWDFTQHKPFKAVYDSNLRSVYLMTQRIQRHPFLALFDGADTNASTARRVTSTTPLQALYLMNDPFVHEQSAAFARRLLAERSDDEERVKLAWLLLFSRQPDANEREMATTYLAQVKKKLGAEKPSDEERITQAWQSLVRSLWMSNEFVYIN
jgi:mono/diheme cytochrome c family protein